MRKTEVVFFPSLTSFLHSSAAEALLFSSSSDSRATVAASNYEMKAKKPKRESVFREFKKKEGKKVLA